MKRKITFVFALLFILIAFGGTVACKEQKTECLHFGGQATCVEQAVCVLCGEHYGTLAPHTYADEFTCHDRACLQEGCTHVEPATTSHLVEKYACKDCGEKFGCSLEILKEDYSEAMLAQAKRNAGELTGDFEVVILGREDAMGAVGVYNFPENFDKNAITRGLFVKFDALNPYDDTILFTLYYNFGLELREDQRLDVSVSAPGTEDAWCLEVVKGNPKLLFKFSIVQY